MNNRTYVQEQLTAKLIEQQAYPQKIDALKKKVREHKIALENKLDLTDSKSPMWLDKIQVLEAIINFLDGVPFPETLFTEYPLYNSGFANSTSSFLETAEKLVQEFTNLESEIATLTFEAEDERLQEPSVTENKLEYPANEQSEIDAKKDEIEAHLDILHDTFENAWLASKKLNCQAKINVLEATLKYLSEQITPAELISIVEANPRYNEYSSNSTAPQLESAKELMRKQPSFPFHSSLFDNDDTTSRITNLQQTYYKLADKNAAKLLQNLPACELWRFFVDGCENSLALPDTNFSQLYAAFTTSFDNCHDTLNISILKKLDRILDTGELRGEESEIVLHNASAAGILEIINNHAFYKNYFYLAVANNPLIFSQKNRKKVAEDTIFKMTDYQVPITIKQPNPPKDFDALLTKIIYEYNYPGLYLTQQEKLLNITTFFQKCLQLQLFPSQAYARHACHFPILLLNHLLIRNGFAPAILHNLDRFYAHSSKELVYDVIQGMENTITLLQEGKLYGIDTNAQRTTENQKYFDAADEIENNKEKILESTFSI